MFASLTNHRSACAALEPCTTLICKQWSENYVALTLLLGLQVIVIGDKSKEIDAVKAIKMERKI